MPLPTTFHSRSTPSSRAPTRPLECTRPITQPMSPSCSARSWPALPEATQTLRPGRVSARSIQRLTAAESSWPWPLVPRLTLIDTGRPSAAPPRRPAGSRRRARSASSRRTSAGAPPRRRGSRSARRRSHASRQTPLLPAAMLATWVPCAPSDICDWRSSSVAGRPSLRRGGDRLVEVLLAQLGAVGERPPGSGACRRPGPRCARSASCRRGRGSPRGRSRSRRRRSARSARRGRTGAARRCRSAAAPRGGGGLAVRDRRGGRAQRLAELDRGHVAAVAQLARLGDRELRGQQLRARRGDAGEAVRRRRRRR